MKNTKIEWCDSTWNPVTGCFHGCEYCYARGIAKRFGGASRTDYEGDCDWCTEAAGKIHDLYNPVEDPDRGKSKAPYPFEFDPTFHRYRLKQPKVWHEPRVIFVCSMADLFGEWVPDEWIDEVFKVCEEAPQHTYLFITKNPSRYCQLDDAGKLPHKANWWFGSTWTKPGDCVFEGGVGTIKERFNTFLSIEPLLAELDITHGLGAFNWVIIGAETGNRKGKVTPKKEWIDKICSTYTATHNPVFMKDSLIPIMGEENMRREFPETIRVKIPMNEAAR